MLLCLHNHCEHNNYWGIAHAGAEDELSIADLMRGLGDAKSQLGPARKALLKTAEQSARLSASLPL